MATMLEYITQTKDTLLNIIDNSKEFTKPLVDYYLNNKCDGLYFVASGSSYNGCYCALDFAQHILHENILLKTPFNFIHHEKPYIGKQMIIAVSQSGCSTNTLDVLKQLKHDGHSTVCLVGRDDCDAKEYADLLVNWQVGEEKIGFVTKGVSSLACFVMVFALELAKARNLIDDNKYQHAKQNFRLSQDIQPEMLHNTIDLFNAHKQDFISRDRVIFLSSGPNLATAKEAALKISETSCINSLVCEAEEFLHGPLYPCTPNDLIIIIDNNDDPSSQRLLDIGLALKDDITPKVYAITNSDRFDDEHAFRTSKQTCLHLSPLYKLTCIQTLAYLMSEATNKYRPHDCVIKFKKANKVASKSRDKLYLNLQEGEH